MNTPRETYFFYDYETDGLEPAQCRVVQVAGQRTDASFQQIGPPFQLLVRPATDRLPSVKASLVHGIGPKQAAAGVEENELADRLMAELERPGTTAVAYNGMSFDHELTRFLCWRTLREPYRWSSPPNARWDPVDTFRAAYALRPGVLTVPLNDEGKPSFKLEHLAAVNDVVHTSAHDAASDVEATIGLVRKLNESAPKLIAWSLRLRNRNHVLNQLDPAADRPVLYVASTTPTEFACTTAILPLAMTRSGSPAVIAWDLRYDPRPFLELPAEELRDIVFTKMKDRDPDAPRPGLMSLRANKNPFVAPLAMLTSEVEARMALSRSDLSERAGFLLEAKGFRGRAIAVYGTDYKAPDDPEEALYAGFVDDQERARLNDVRRNPVAAVQQGLRWRDPRLEEVVFRFAARNFYKAAGGDIRKRWRAYCRGVFLAENDAGEVAFDAWLREVNEEAANADDDAKRALIDEIRAHGQALKSWSLVP